MAIILQVCQCHSMSTGNLGLGVCFVQEMGVGRGVGLVQGEIAKRDRMECSRLRVAEYIYVHYCHSRPDLEFVNQGAE